MICPIPPTNNPTGQLPQSAQSPPKHDLPPTQDAATVARAEIPTQVRPARAPPRPPQSHHPPAKHRERDEEDRGEQHAGVHLRRQGQQEADQGGVEEALRCRLCQDQHADQAGWIEEGVCEVDAGCGCAGYRGDEVGDCLKGCNDYVGRVDESGC